MDIVHPELNRYAEAHTTPEGELLRKINEETHGQVRMPRMLSGHLQGRILSMISRMIRPSAILEIGTFTGYSALCLAEGLGENGRLVTIDNNAELENRVRSYWQASPLGSRIDFRVGNALEIIPGLTGPFELVFIDADKKNYSRYFDLVIDKVSPGGFLLADNVLWSGKVLDEKPDKDTRAILEFNDKIQGDSRVENVMLPVRDGLFLMRRIK